jgi:hypothetical protein
VETHGSAEGRDVGRRRQLLRLKWAVSGLLVAFGQFRFEEELRVGLEHGEVPRVVGRSYLVARHIIYLCGQIDLMASSEGRRFTSGPTATRVGSL